MNGTRWLSRRSSSNDVEPAPITIAARSTVAGTARVEEHLLDLEAGAQVVGQVAVAG